MPSAVLVTDCTWHFFMITNTDLMIKNGYRHGLIACMMNKMSSCIICILHYLDFLGERQGIALEGEIIEGAKKVCPVKKSCKYNPINM